MKTIENNLKIIGTIKEQKINSSSTTEQTQKTITTSMNNNIIIEIIEKKSDQNIEYNIEANIIYEKTNRQRLIILNNCSNPIKEIEDRINGKFNQIKALINDIDMLQITSNEIKIFNNIITEVEFEPIYEPKPKNKTANRIPLTNEEEN